MPLILTAFAVLAAPTTQSYRGVDDVERAFKAKLAAAEREFYTQARSAREERLRALRELQDRAMQNQDIDLAVSLREKIKAAESDLDQQPATPGKRGVQADMVELENRLKDSLWHWHEDFVRFKPDGTMQNANWDSRKLVTTWKVIDRRTVLLAITGGRNQDRYAVLTFNEQADGFDGYSFDGTKLPLNKVIQEH